MLTKPHCLRGPLEIASFVGFAVNCHEQLDWRFRRASLGFHSSICRPTSELDSVYSVNAGFKWARKDEHKARQSMCLRHAVLHKNKGFTSPENHPRLSAGRGIDRSEQQVTIGASSRWNNKRVFSLNVQKAVDSRLQSGIAIGTLTGFGDEPAASLELETNRRAGNAGEDAGLQGSESRQNTNGGESRGSNNLEATNGSYQEAPGVSSFETPGLDNIETPGVSSLQTPGVITAEASVSEGETSASQEYAEELEVATHAVQLACLLSQRIQQDMLRDREQARLKKDKSLVTVADYGVQAVISHVLSNAFPNEPLAMVAEESTDALKGREEMATLRKVVDAVNVCLEQSPLVGLPAPSEPLSTVDVLKAINRGKHQGGPTGRFWVLDPVDGTLGFVRGDQYAVALALVDRGEIVLGVLGCPNLPLRKEWMRHQHRFYRAAEAFFPPPRGLWHKGIVFRARKGGGGAWAEPLVSADVTRVRARGRARRAFVSPVTDPAKATFCEPVEKANSNQSLTAGLAAGLGISSKPLRAYSMAKYGMLAKGDAEIFMKFARGDYKEKIWDHAAGCFIVQEAGGVVTDAGGRPLDFSRGRFLQGLDRGIIASCNPSLHRRLLAALDASYDSSTL